MISARITDPDNVEVTVSITLTSSAWRQFMDKTESLKSDSPIYLMREAIHNVLDKVGRKIIDSELTKSFYNENS